MSKHDDAARFVVNPQPTPEGNLGMASVSIRKKRTHQSVSWDNEVRPIVEKVKSATGLNDSEIAEKIGYAKSVLTPSAILRSNGQVPLRMKLALEAYFNSLNLGEPPPPIGWSVKNFNDAELLFDACRTAAKAFPNRKETFQRLMAVFSQEMLRFSK